MTDTTALDTARREAFNAHGVETGTVKPGRCGVTGCTESHPVYAFAGMWRNASTGEAVRQYKGTHHGQTFVYETFMVHPDAS